ncbi:hypothetical protein C2E23DRAFT_889091 [Lenzites betulinus]|nr:hypothetical protein C2E23DRAFT_889091 [Lenzites betulinus]
MKPTREFETAQPFIMSLSANTTSAGAIPLAPLPVLPALDNTFGAILIGTCVGLILYGLTGHQTYRYFRLYANDVPILKALGTVIFVCHSFYVRRLYLVGGLYKPLIALVITLMFGELGFVIAATAKVFHQPSFVSWERFTWLISAGFGCAVGADVVLTSSLICVLQRRRTGFKSTDSMIDVLIVYTINTGLLTGLFSLLSLIFAVVDPNNFIYIGLNMISTRCYANSVLAVLNSRRSLVERRFAELEAGTFGMSALDTDESRLRATVQADIAQLPEIRPNILDIKLETGHRVQRIGSNDTTRDVSDKETV